MVSCYIIIRLTKKIEHTNKTEKATHIETWQQEENFTSETFRRVHKSDLLMLNQAIKSIIHQRNA